MRRTSSIFILPNRVYRLATLSTWFLQRRLSTIVNRLSTVLTWLFCPCPPLAMLRARNSVCWLSSTIWFEVDSKKALEEFFDRFAARKVNESWMKSQFVDSSLIVECLFSIYDDVKYNAGRLGHYSRPFNYLLLISYRLQKKKKKKMRDRKRKRKKTTPKSHIQTKKQLLLHFFFSYRILYLFE